MDYDIFNDPKDELWEDVLRELALRKKNIEKKTYERYVFQKCDPLVWTTKEGEEIHITEMGPNHIKNVIRYISKKCEDNDLNPKDYPIYNNLVKENHLRNKLKTHDKCDRCNQFMPKKESKCHDNYIYCKACYESVSINSIY